MFKLKCNLAVLIYISLEFLFFESMFEEHKNGLLCSIDISVFAQRYHTITVHWFAGEELQFLEPTDDVFHLFIHIGFECFDFIRLRFGEFGSNSVRKKIEKMLKSERYTNFQLLKQLPHKTKCSGRQIRTKLAGDYKTSLFCVDERKCRFIQRIVILGVRKNQQRRPFKHPETVEVHLKISNSRVIDLLLLLSVYCFCSLLLNYFSSERDANRAETENF